MINTDRQTHTHRYIHAFIFTVVTMSMTATNLAATQYIYIYIKRISKGENTLKSGNWVIVIKMYFKVEILF